MKYDSQTRAPSIPEGEPPTSKTRRKKDMQALQDLGETLARLPPEQIARLGLPDELSEALLEAGRIRSHGAHRRQLQYIGRLMRDQDAAAIAERLADLQGESDAARARFHAVERWRNRLLEDDASLAEWTERYGSDDTQQLRQLIRNARREREEGLPPKAGRALFRLLREREQEQGGGHA